MSVRFLNSWPHQARRTFLLLPSPFFSVQYLRHGALWQDFSPEATPR
ncbi:MAG: hypothetical protein MI923_13110 [Phycisphaerales bacterium]|nr:hypothetical protein [Phycisphaerales bacterium]